jgi:hypothetical protein
MTRAINPQPARPGLMLRLFAPLDIASLAAFRVLFGLAMFVDMCLYTKDKIAYHWLEPAFLFKYYGFEWVQVLPGDGMIYLVWALRALAVLIMLGCCYRVAAPLFFLGFTYTFLVDQAEHLNHSYLICLISFLMIFLPANRAFSLDAKVGTARRAVRALSHVPAWTVWILRFQVGVPYFFGGLAKLNSDWFHGEPMRTWLVNRAHMPVIGPLFNFEATIYFFALGGLALDLLAVPLLLCRKTRPWILPPLVFFHLMNAWLFDIGIFPWLMLAATTIFFEPDWPRRFARSAGCRVSGVGADHSTLVTRHSQRHVVCLLSIYVLIQVAAPLRHAAYPGNVNWTEEGHRFSWRMKLRSKFGSAHFYVTDPSSRRTWLVNPRDYVNPVQAMRMAARPDMVLQMAKLIARDMAAQGHSNVAVRVRDLVSLNGRKPRLLVDPDVDLAAQPRNLHPAPWILPLTDPLPPRGAPLYEPAELANVQRQLQERRALQHTLATLARIIDEKTDELAAVDADLERTFSVDAASDYRFDADRNSLLRSETDPLTGRAVDIVVKQLTNGPERQLFMELVGRRMELRREVSGLHVIEAEKLAAERRLYDVFDSEGAGQVE